MYQSKPPNYLLGVKFAHGYVYFVCTGPVKWAEFASEVVKNVTNEGHLDRKIDQWKLETSQVSIGTPSGSAILLVNTPSGSTLVGSGPFATTQSCLVLKYPLPYKNFLLRLENLMTMYQPSVRTLRMLWSNLVHDVHRCEGALDTI